MSILVVIPARGGSKGIPRKNLRTLHGKPLLQYSIGLALASRHEPTVVVTSDDEEILTIAERLGAVPHLRDPELAADATTLDPVVHAAYGFARTALGHDFDLVVTLQPTSPLLRSESLDDALSAMLEEQSVDTLLSACEDTHLSWHKQGEQFLPSYRERLNRQQLSASYRETGGFVITRARHVTPTSRFGENVQLHLLPRQESIDIDDYHDWAVCEFLLARKRIVFVVGGNRTIGLGHAYNALILAQDILKHELHFLIPRGHELAHRKIAAHNYDVTLQRSGVDLVDEIAALEPDLVINDILDTAPEYMRQLRVRGIKTANFEDLGPGAGMADLVINAIYPEQEKRPRHHFGQPYFLIRDEFLLGEPPAIEPEVAQVLVSFGGVDPCNLTRHVLRAIDDYCAEYAIDVSVVAGLGYEHFESLEEFQSVRVYRDVKNISEHMRSADIVFTSAGRTVYEVASLARPTIILAQNAREQLHFFAAEEFGFCHLGLGSKIPEEKILDEFVNLVRSPVLREGMSERMRKNEFRSNRARVSALIESLLEE